MSGSAARGTSHPASDEDAGRAPKKKAKKKAKGARGGLRCKGASDVSSEDNETHSSTAEDDEEEEESNSP